MESILPSTRAILPVPPGATKPQSIMDPSPCLTVGKVFFFAKDSPLFLKSGHKVQFIVPKGLRLLSVCFFVLSGHVDLCCSKYVVLLSSEQLDLCLLLVFAAFLQ